MSAEDQLREQREFVAQQDGWTLDAEFKDEAISGTLGREHRRGWDELLRYLEAGGLPRGGVVLVWDIDRWSRDWSDGMIEALRLHKHGIDLADTKDGVLDQDSLAGKLMLTLKIAGADEFVKKLRRNVKRGLAAKREAGYWTQPAPYGMTTERQAGGSVLVPFAREIEVYHEIMRGLDAGLTPAALARNLNAENIPTRRNSRWTPATILGIACNPVYLGKIVRYDSHRDGATRTTRWYMARGLGEIFEGQHTAVVDPLLWQRVHDRWAPGQPRSRRNTRPRKFPLSGLVVCGTCGRTCQITGGEWPYRNYRCRPYGREVECGNRRIVRVEYLEDAVRAWANQFISDERIVDLVAQKIADQEREEARRLATERVPVEAEISDLERKRERLFEALYAGNAPALINERLEQVERTLQAARVRMADIGENIESIDAQDVRRELCLAFETASTDLHRIREVVTCITLPAEIDEPITLEAFEQVFSLLIDRSPKDRTRAAVAGYLCQQEA